MIRIWEDASLTREERVARIRALREELSDDEMGRAAAAAIDAFLRESGVSP